MQSIERAERVLRLLSAPRHRLGLGEIASELSLPKTTVFGILRTLQELGLVERDAESGRYGLGAAVVRLGASYLESSPLRSSAVRWAEALAERSNETVRLGVLHEDRVLVLHHVFRHGDGHFPTGAVLPAHATALGKVLLAGAPRGCDALDPDSLVTFTARTLTDRERLAEEVDETRRRGWAASREELIEGRGALAAPIRDAGGGTVGALSIAAPIGRLLRGGQPNPGLALLVRDFAGAISRDLGAPPWQLSEELSRRFAAELERSQQAASALRREVSARRREEANAWIGPHGPYGHATWELERTLERRRSQLAETERQLSEMRGRLAALERSAGQPPPHPGVTARPAPPSAQPVRAGTGRGTSAGAEPAGAVAAGPSRGAPASASGAAFLRSAEARLLAEELANQLLRRSQAALARQFRSELGQCLDGQGPEAEGSPDREPLGRSA